MMFSIKRKSYISAIGCITITLACAVIVGWQFDIAQLKSIIPGIRPMNPVTASTFILCGIWMLLYQKRNLKRWLFLICCIVIAIGLIHFITYFFPTDIRMDYLFYGEKIKQSGVQNLIAPNTALMFILSGITMFTTTTKRHWILVMRQALIMVGFALVYISLLGYIYDIEPAYRMGSYTPMSLYTALVFLLFNTGLFLSNTDYGISRIFVSRLSGSRLLRVGFIIMLFIPPVIGYLRLQGERRGLYPTEVGVELNTLVFTMVVLILIVQYASLENKKQLLNIRAEKQLAASELKFRTIFNSLKEGVACIDYQGRMLYCNPSYCHIVGYEENELIGQVVIEKIIPHAELPAFYKLLEERRAGKEADYQTPIVRKNGERIWIDIKSKTMKDADGNAYAYLVSVYDITEERNKLQDLQAFSGSAAHDLNAPLGRVMTMTDFLLSDDIDEVEKKMFISGIADTVRSMRQLLQDLLSFSKLGSGQLEKQDLDIAKMVKEICAEQTPQKFKGEIVVNGLPHIKGNEGAIKQLFTNLISNAIKYSSKKDFTRVEVGAYNNNNQTIYYIKDNGVGLSQDQIATLFTPFKRYHTDFEGNGLGLAIVKRVVEKHGGNIWAESTPGNGLTFHFTLEPDRQG